MEYRKKPSVWTLRLGNQNGQNETNKQHTQKTDF